MCEGARGGSCRGGKQKGVRTTVYEVRKEGVRSVPLEVEGPTPPRPVSFSPPFVPTRWTGTPVPVGDLGVGVTLLSGPTKLEDTPRGQHLRRF